jgi:hypothetical protein
MSRLGRLIGSPLTAPPNFLEELEREFAEASAALVRAVDRFSLLAELQRIGLDATLRLGRPVTLIDVLETTRTEEERLRLEGLVRRLRAD